MPEKHGSCCSSATRARKRPAPGRPFATSRGMVFSRAGCRPRRRCDRRQGRPSSSCRPCDARPARRPARADRAGWRPPRCRCRSSPAAGSRRPRNGPGCRPRRSGCRPGLRHWECCRCRRRRSRTADWVRRSAVRASWPKPRRAAQQQRGRERDSGMLHGDFLIDSGYLPTPIVRECG